MKTIGGGGHRFRFVDSDDVIENIKQRTIKTRC